MHNAESTAHATAARMQRVHVTAVDVTQGGQSEHKYTSSVPAKGNFRFDAMGAECYVAGHAEGKRTRWKPLRCNAAQGRAHGTTPPSVEPLKPVKKFIPPNVTAKHFQ